MLKKYDFKPRKDGKVADKKGKNLRVMSNTYAQALQKSRRDRQKAPATAKGTKPKASLIQEASQTRPEAV
jgi:hypothetical protein